MNPMNASVATGNDQKEADRKHWGGPAGTVLNVLQSAQLTDTASSDMSDVGSVEGAAEADRTKVTEGQDGGSDSKEGRWCILHIVIFRWYSVKNCLY